MRILVFSNLTPYVTGGAERQVRLLVEGWAKGGHHVLVAGSKLPAETIGHNFNITLYTASANSIFGRPGRALSYFISICLVLYRLRGKYDIIYCRFLTDSACSVAFLKQLGIINKPLVACPASSGPGGDAEFLMGMPFTKVLVSILSKQCDAINLISRGISNEMEELRVKPQKWSNISNGVIQSSAPESMQESDYIRLIFIGGLRKQKGVDLLLTAISIVSLRGHKVTLEIIGDGPDRGILEDQIKSLQLEKFIQFTGILSSKNIVLRLKNAHVLVLPSRWEGMANVALEAMAIGRPVIVSRCDGIDQYVDQSCGWTVRKDDIADLAEKITCAAQLPVSDLESMGRISFQLIKNKFNLNHAVKAYINLFNSILSDEKSKIGGDIF